MKYGGRAVSWVVDRLQRSAILRETWKPSMIAEISIKFPEIEKQLARIADALELRKELEADARAIAEDVKNQADELKDDVSANTPTT